MKKRIIFAWLLLAGALFLSFDLTCSLLASVSLSFGIPRVFTFFGSLILFPLSGLLFLINKEDYPEFFSKDKKEITGAVLWILGMIAGLGSGAVCMQATDFAVVLIFIFCFSSMYYGAVLMEST